MKFNMDQKEIIDKLFVLGFVWMTPMSFLGILRSSLMWILVNGVEVDIPLREYIEDTASSVQSEANAEEESQEEEGEEEVQSKSQDEEWEEEVQSKSQEEEESTLQTGITKMWSS